MKKLKSFQENQKIPHILFHGGTTGYEKEHIVSTFINHIYHCDRKQLKTNVLVVNCSGKGIKFIRDEIKTFSKMHLSTESSLGTATFSSGFKTVVLLNADFLTEDAQSALRRSIELFSSNTRFFMIVENKYKLLKPILSRFCEIYMTNRSNQQKNPVANEKNDFDNNIQRILRLLPPASTIQTVENCEDENNHPEEKDPIKTMNQATGLYEAGISSYDLASFIERTETNIERRIYTLFFFHKIKAEYRCEKMLLATLLDFWHLEPARSYERLKNMTTTI